MKNLYIIRHAKAKLFREGQEDHDRELNKTGKIEASICGKWINNLDKKLDIIYSSSSVRTHQTTKIIIEEIEYNPQINMINWCSVWATVKNGEPLYSNINMVTSKPDFITLS